jgi:hypothetical protein
LTATARAPQLKEDDMTDADNRPAVVGQVEPSVRPLPERLRARKADRTLHEEAAQEIERLTRLYYGLVMLVGNKHAGETRHETAARYIRQAERSTCVSCDGTGQAIFEGSACEPCGGGGLRPNV